MSGGAMSYRRQALLGDYLRAAVGGLLTGVPLLFVEPSPATLAVLGGLTALFVLFGLRTLLRHLTTVTMTPDGVAVEGPLGGSIDWRGLDQLRLGYFTTRRDRQGGWMQLTLRGGSRRLKFDSSLDGFDRLVRRAVLAATANGVEFDGATMANLAALDIAPPPAGGRPPGA